jgi:hypothetical protein
MSGSPPFPLVYRWGEGNFRLDRFSGSDRSRLSHTSARAAGGRSGDSRAAAVPSALMKSAGGFSSAIESSLPRKQYIETILPQKLSSDAYIVLREVDVQ